MVLKWPSREMKTGRQCKLKCEMEWLHVLFVSLTAVLGVYTQADFDRENILVKTLEKCHRNSTTFDPCIKDAANLLRSEFKTGIEAFKIPPFDPFHIKEVSTSRLNIKLKLRNVSERGWSLSRVTGMKVNLPARTIIYHQFFPEKYLDGDYEISTNLLTSIQNEGRFNLSLFNYTQVTTVRWTRPREPMKIHIRALDSKDMTLHLTNLAGGRQVVENMLDRIINAAWRPGFTVLKPVIDDLVSKAFTKIFNDALQNVPFEQFIPE